MYKIIGADQKEYGPVSLDQLRQWLSEGRVNGATRVQAEGSFVWKTLSELPEFAPAVPSIPAAPLPPPPLSMPSPTASPALVTNKLAAWSMGLGIFVLVVCCLWMLSPLPIILGFVALSQIKANPNQKGQGYAITGIVTGLISLLIGIGSFIFVTQHPEFMKGLNDSLNSMNR